MTIVSYQTFQTTHVKAGSKANTKNKMAGVIAFECLSIAGPIYSFWYIEMGPKSPFIFPNNINRTVM